VTQLGTEFNLSNGLLDESRRRGLGRDDLDKKSTAALETDCQVQEVNCRHGDRRRRWQGAYLKRRSQQMP